MSQVLQVCDRVLRVRDIPRHMVSRVLARKPGSGSAKRLTDREIDAIGDVAVERPYRADPCLYGVRGASKKFATVVVALKDEFADEYLKNAGAAS
jgi:hypothetical protein